MAKILYDFDIEGALQADPFLDSFELSVLFEQTKQSMQISLERKLGNLQCEEHAQEPTITITGRYNAEIEQMDIQYHIDTCCKLFLVRVVKTLNNVN